MYKETKIYKMPEIKIENIESVYVGKPNRCMCGCSGTHFYPKINQKFSSENRGYPVREEEVNDIKVERVLRKVSKNAIIGIDVLDDSIYTIIIGKTQYTIYTK